MALKGYENIFASPDNSMGAVVKRARRRHVASGLQSGYNGAI